VHYAPKERQDAPTCWSSGNESCRHIINDSYLNQFYNYESHFLKHSFLIYLIIIIIIIIIIEEEEEK
jgi:hypothetical protein